MVTYHNGQTKVIFGVGRKTVHYPDYQHKLQFKGKQKEIYKQLAAEIKRKFKTANQKNSKDLRKKYNSFIEEGEFNDSGKLIIGRKTFFDGTLIKYEGDIDKKYQKWCDRRIKEQKKINN